MFEPVADKANVPAFVTSGVVKDVEAERVVKVEPPVLSSAGVVIPFVPSSVIIYRTTHLAPVETVTVTPALIVIGPVDMALTVAGMV
jgi:hypothetical protein